MHQKESILTRPSHARCSSLRRAATLVRMSNIDELLMYEENVIADTRRLLDAFSPELIEALDMAMGMYSTFGRIVGQDSDHAADIAEANDCAKQLGVKDEAEGGFDGVPVDLLGPGPVEVGHRFEAAEAAAREAVRKGASDAGEGRCSARLLSTAATPRP